jgi:acetoin utilization deacetylase AcuC-like enzyme
MLRTIRRRASERRALARVQTARRRARLVALAPRPATDVELVRVHTRELIARVDASGGRPRVRFDSDTATSPASSAAARLAAGCLVELCDAVLAGQVDNGLALVRPPGHHAERDRAMGFCLYNNVAVAAQGLRARGVARVAIVDWDLHHGNGTQHIFEDDPSVLYVSTHQYPFYPGTGGATEVGHGAGAGRTLNVPCPAGFGDAEFAAVFDELIVPALRRFAPDFVLVSAGFDCDGRDPLGGLTLTPDGIARMARALVAVRASARGRIVAVLEGGYDLEALVDGTGALDAFQGATAPLPAPRGGDRAGPGARSRAAHACSGTRRGAAGAPLRRRPQVEAPPGAPGGTARTSPRNNGFEPGTAFRGSVPATNTRGEWAARHRALPRRIDRGVSRRAAWEIDGGTSLERPAHELHPDRQGRSRAGLLPAQRRVRVVPDPDAGQQIGTIADEPRVAIFVGGPGLPGERPSQGQRGPGRSA